MDYRTLVLHNLILQPICLVFLCRGELNLALKKRTYQSSHNGDKYSYLAVDGNRDRSRRNSCARTRHGNPSWWYVDLLDNYVIKGFAISSEKESSGSLKNALVEVSADDPNTLVGFPERTSSPLCWKFDVEVPNTGSTSYYCREAVLGRYVRVLHNGTLSICEFELFGDTVPTSASREPAPIKPDTNLALKKPAYQSSDYIFGFAGMATDGDRNGDFGGKSCTHTFYGPAQWWYVDLQDEYVIGRITITNRLGAWDRLNNFAVEVSIADPRTLPGFPGRTSSPVCRTFSKPIPNNGPQAYDCEKPIVGRYVRVAKMDSVQLTICEFEVYLPAAPPTTEASTTQPSPTLQNTELTTPQPSPPLLTTHEPQPSASPTIPWPSEAGQRPKQLKTVTGVPSALRCGIHCSVHPQSPCRYIAYHPPSGLCRLLANHVIRETAPGPQWLVYKRVS